LGIELKNSWDNIAKLLWRRHREEFLQNTTAMPITGQSELVARDLCEHVPDEQGFALGAQRRWGHE
jgi:hypothetical protein